MTNRPLRSSSEAARERRVADGLIDAMRPFVISIVTGAVDAPTMRTVVRARSGTTALSLAGGNDAHPLANRTLSETSATLIHRSKVRGYPANQHASPSLPGCGGDPHC
jgi:hypothetical protein